MLTGRMISVMKYKREIASAELMAEMMPMFRKHYEEIAHYKDIPLDPIERVYLDLESVGGLRVYTARELGGQLVGYAVFSVFKNPHYASSLEAKQDVLYIAPESRGFGMDFILWCDNQLKADGIKVVYQHVKIAHDFGPMLKFLGYELIENIYGKRLDLEE